MIKNSPISLNIAKLALYGLFFNYYGYFILRGSFIPFGTYIFYGIALIGVMIAGYREPIRFSFNIKCWIGYFLFSIATIPLAYSKSYAIDGLEKFFQRLLLIILIAYICEREKSIGFSIRLLAATGIFAVLSCLFTMNSFSQKLTVSSGAGISTNDIGSIAAFSCFAILFAFGVGEKSRLHKTILKVAFIISAIVIVFVAGSRKSIIAIILMFALFFIFCWRDYFVNMTIPKFITIVVVGVIAYYFVSKYLIPNAEDTNLYVRLFGRGAERTAESDEGRWNLYLRAFNDFKDNFIFGLGFNNFVFLHSMYSHSTYVEPLACSGLGALLYLIPYIYILVNQFKLSFLETVEPDVKKRVFNKEMLAFYITVLFVGIGIPFIYKDVPCIVLAMFTAYQKLEFDRLTENNYEILTEVEKNERSSDKSIAGNV